MRGRKALRNVISSLGVQFVIIICGFIVPRLILSAYGSKVNGAVSSITQFLAFITLLESGFGPVIKAILFKPIANKDKDTIKKILKAAEKIFRKISYIFIAYIIVLCVFLPIKLQNEFDALFTISMIIIISISTFSEYFFGMTYTIYLQAEQKSYINSSIRMFSLIANAIVVFLLVKCGASIQIVKLISSLIYVIRPVFLNIYVKKKYGIYLKDVKEKYEIKQKWDGLSQHIAYVVYKNIDIMILTLCGNLIEISVYSVYYMVVNRIRNIVQSFIGGIDDSFGDMLARGEKDNLNKNFKMYETVYLTIVTIVFSSTLFLIVPFVKAYTTGITDADYIRTTFAFLIVVTELIAAIRQPYQDLVKVAGRFKETRIGAWVEAISNAVISLALVWNFGIVGVAIGTLISMLVRTIEFVCYASKQILYRSLWQTIKNSIVIVLEIALISIIMNFIPKYEAYSYGTWAIKGLCVFIVSSIVVLMINWVVYKDSFKMIIAKIKNFFTARNNSL